MDLNNVNNLIVVLQALNANDTTTVKNAEKTLKPFVKNHTSAVALMQVLRSGADEAARHQATLLLRKKMAKFYPKYSAPQQATLKNELVTALLTEQVGTIATGIAGIIAAAAEAIYKNHGQWPELFQLLLQLVQDPNEKHRILTFKLLSELAETIPQQLKPHAETLANLFLMGCQDGVSAVAQAALSAIAATIPLLGKSPEIMIFSKVINPMLAVMNKCLTSGDEDLVIEGLDVIQECCALEQPLINDHLEVVVQFVLSILLHPEHEAAVKQSAGQTLMDVIEYRPKLFAKKNLIAPTLSMLMDRIANEKGSVAGSLFNFPHSDSILQDEGKQANGDDEDDESFDPAEEVQKLSQTIIDTMAIHIPSKYFTDTVLSMISQGMSSPNPQMRKAGCAVLGVVAEGCQERLRESLNTVLPALLQSIEDPEIHVRECACFALGQFAEHLQPEILNYHDTVLPAIFKALSDHTQVMQGTSCYVLEFFCEYLQPNTLKPYLAPLMNKLGELAQSSSRGIQEMALTALSATAIAAEHEFVPYANAVVGFLTQLLFLTEPVQLTTRGKALDCMGHIAIALGKEHFQQSYFELGMRSTMQGFEMDNELLKEHGFVYIANVVKLMEKEFKPFMDQFIPYIHSIIEESEIFKVISDDEEEGEGGAAGGGGAGGEEDEDDEEADYRLNIMEGFISTKKAAITALGALAEHTKSVFLPHLKPSLELLITKDIGSLYSFHDDIRAEAVSVLDYFVEALCEGHNLKVPAKREVIQLPPDLAELTVACLGACLHIIEKDEEKLPVSNALETIHAILRRLGVVVLHLTIENKPFAAILLEHLLVFVREKAKCQVASKVENSTEGGDDEDDDDDHDHVVIDSVSDLIGCLAKLLGPDFLPYFDTFHPHLMKFTKASRVPSDRIMAIGCYAEVIDEVGAGAIKYAEVLLPVLKEGLNDEVENCRRNAAYCLGALIEKTERALVPHFLLILQWLHPVCVRKSSERSDYVGGADIDNAISTVARMIHVAPDAVPLSQVLPVMLSALPMREDFDESTVVFSTIYKLVQSNEPNTFAILPQIVAALGDNFRPASKAPAETRVIAAETFKLLGTNPQAAPIVQQYISSIQDPVHVQRLQQELQAS